MIPTPFEDGALYLGQVLRSAKAFKRSKERKCVNGTFLRILTEELSTRKLYGKLLCKNLFGDDRE